MSIEVFNESGRADVNEEMLIDVLSFALMRMDINPDAEASIYVVDLDTIADLHERWLDLEGPTDVMSFPVDELTPGMSGTPAVPSMLGDLVLCPDFAEQQAQAAGHDLSHELALLTVHGCLHLLGYDHSTPKEEHRMFAMQNEILADWYDDLDARGVRFQPKPTGSGAFPTASQREQLDRNFQFSPQDSLNPEKRDSQ